MGKWGESKLLSEKSWSLLRENRYLLWFPIIGFAIAVIPLAAFGLWALSLWNVGSTFAAIVVGVIGLVLVSFVFSLSGGAIVAAVDEELAGRDASVGSGFRRAFAHVGALAVWALVQAAVSALLGLIRGNPSNGAGEGRRMLAGVGGAAWSIVTLFVTPFIVLQGQGPIQAMKSSVLMVKEKWGLQVTGGVRIGVRLFILIIPAIVLIFVGSLLFFNQGTYASLGLILIVIGIALAVVWALIANAVRAIFAVALFHFTIGDGAIPPFTEAELTSVLAKKSSP